MEQTTTVALVVLVHNSLAYSPNRCNIFHMRVLSASILLIFVAGAGLADEPPSSCPSTVTSCTFTYTPGASGFYNVTYDQNPTPFWEVDPVSGWPPVFKALLTPSELASGTVPYNVEYDFIVGTSLSQGASGEVTVDFQPPTSLTNWVVVGYPDDSGGNNATVLTASGGSTGAPFFGSGSGSAYVLTAVPGELVVSTTATMGNAGDTEFTGMFIGEIVPEPQTGLLVLLGTLMAAGAIVIRRQRAL